MRLTGECAGGGAGRAWEGDAEGWADPADPLRRSRSPVSDSVGSRESSVASRVSRLGLPAPAPAIGEAVVWICVAVSPLQLVQLELSGFMVVVGKGGLPAPRRALPLDVDVDASIRRR